MFAGLVVHPFDAARDVLRFYRDFITSTPDELVVLVVHAQGAAASVPPGGVARQRDSRAGHVLRRVGCGRRAHRQAAAVFRHAAGRRGRAAAVRGVADAFDPLLTPGARNYWKSHDFTQLSDGFIDALLAAVNSLPDPNTEIAVAQIGGAVSRVANDATAYGHRDAQWVMNVHGRWMDAAKDEDCIGWARGLFQAAAPFATGAVYVNFLTQDEQDRVRAAYGANYARLAALKRRYDPTNLFRMNQNISPAPPAADRPDMRPGPSPSV